MTPTEFYPGNIRKRRLMEYLQHHPEETSELPPKKPRIEQQENNMEALKLENREIKIEPFEVGLEISIEDFREDPEETWDAYEVASDSQAESVASHPEAVFQAIILKHFKALKQDPEKDQQFLNETVGEAISPAMREYEDLSNKLASAYKKHHKLQHITMQELDNLQKRKQESFQLLKELEELKTVVHEIKELRYHLCSQAEELGKEESEQPQTPKRIKALTENTKISATSTPITKKRKTKMNEIFEKFEANEEGMVEIGPNGTMIAKNFLICLNWSLSGAALTRKILVEVFGRDTLACHTLTGKPSPAFMDCEKPLKNQLDPMKVEDIIHLMQNYTALTPKEIRSAITTKCADENKMLRQRKCKKSRQL